MRTLYPAQFEELPQGFLLENDSLGQGWCLGASEGVENGTQPTYIQSRFPIELSN